MAPRLLPSRWRTRTSFDERRATNMEGLLNQPRPARVWNATAARVSAGIFDLLAEIAHINKVEERRIPPRETPFQQNRNQQRHAGALRAPAMENGCPVAGRNTYPFGTRTVWPTRVSNLQSAASAIPTTMRSPKRSTAFTRQKSFIAVGRGETYRPSNSPRFNGWIGSITGACLKTIGNISPAEAEARYYEQLAGAPMAA
jgi:hypothetical protein